MTDYLLARTEVLSRNEFRAQPMRLFRNWLIRRKIKALVDLDDHVLEDIGIERDEIRWASRLPLTVNAAVALNDRARRRRAEFHSRRR